MLMSKEKINRLTRPIEKQEPKEKPAAIAQQPQIQQPSEMSHQVCISPEIQAMMQGCMATVENSIREISGAMERSIARLATIKPEQQKIDTMLTVKQSSNEWIHEVKRDDNGMILKVISKRN